MAGKRTAASEPDANHDDGALRLILENWLPYQLSFVANRVSQTLEAIYRTEYGMTVAAWRVMAVLGFKAPLSGREVAELAAMDQVQVTRAINHLRTLGYITRRTDRGDRRKALLGLTGKGQEVYQKIVPRAQEIEKQLLISLSAGEIEALRSATLHLVENARKLA